jgi:CdiI immunity protein
LIGHKPFKVFLFNAKIMLKKDGKGNFILTGYPTNKGEISMNDHQAFEEVAYFLAGTFHQDMGSPEQALADFIVEATKECLEFTLESLLVFMRTNTTEKEEFIKFHAEFYFPSMGLTPLEWLENVIEQLKEAVKTK